MSPKNFGISVLVIAYLYVLVSPCLCWTSAKVISRISHRSASIFYSSYILYPVSSLGTLLDPESVRMAIALRVGADVCIPHSCRCGGKKNGRGLHGLSCKYSAGRIPRHLAMNDVIKRALQKAGLQSVLEETNHALMV